VRAAQTTRFRGGRVAVAESGFPIVCDADTVQICMALYAFKPNGLVTSIYLCFLSRSEWLQLLSPPPLPGSGCPPFFNLQLPPSGRRGIRQRPAAQQTLLHCNSNNSLSPALATPCLQPPDATRHETICHPWKEKLSKSSVSGIWFGEVSGQSSSSQ
jgi:hypothetical protein